MNELESLIYVSTAAAHFRVEDVAVIIERSQTMNQRDGVCGLLLYCDNRFMQCIEGSADGVQRTYRRILAASGHQDVVELFNGSLAHRHFSRWDCAYRSQASLQYSSPQTRRFLALQNGPGHAFIEQNILAGFWNGSGDINDLWASH